MIAISFFVLCKIFLMNNWFPYFIIPLIVGLLVQWIKIFIDFFLEKTIKLDYLRRSGWFPSVHGAIIGSIIALTYVVDGDYSISFAISIAIGILIWNDAVNIRQEAWKHAHILNVMRREISELKIEIGEITHIKKNFLLLKERLWHTIWELTGGIIIGIGITLAILFLAWALFKPLI